MAKRTRRVERSKEIEGSKARRVYSTQRVYGSQDLKNSKSRDSKDINLEDDSGPETYGPEDSLVPKIKESNGKRSLTVCSSQSTTQGCIGNQSTKDSGMKDVTRHLGQKSRRFCQSKNTVAKKIRSFCEP